MKRTWQCLGVMLLLLSSGLRARAEPLAQTGTSSGSWGEPGDLYLEWTLSGADMKLREGYSTSYEGTWNGGAITLSGMATMTRAKGYTSYISLEASVGDQKLLWPAEGGMIEVEGRTESKSFNLAYQVPSGYEGTSIPGRIRVDYCAQSCSYYALTFGINLPTTSLEPPAEPTLTTAPVPEPQATPCTEKTKKQRQAKLIDTYYRRIPKGIAASGPTNNLWYELGYPEYDEYRCGGYQAKVLALLDGLKFSTDPCERALLDDWDYGPIEAFKGWHQAVVIYPRGTEWMKTGIVLDPWFWQIPKVYSIGEWLKVVAYQYPAGSSTYSEEKSALWPTVGGDYTTFGDYKNPEEEGSFLRALPEEKRSAYRRMRSRDRAFAIRWLENAMRGRGPLRKVTAHCPLNLYLVGLDSARSGFPGGQPVYDLAGVTIGRLALSDGTYWTELEYPEGAGYTLILEGTGNGQAHVLTGDGMTLEPESSGAYQYAFQVEAGRTYQMPTDSLGQPIVSEGTALQPTFLPQGSEPDWVSSLPSLAAIPEFDAGGLASPRPLSGWLLLGGGLVLVLALAAGAVLLVRRRSGGSGRARSLVPGSEPPAPAAAAPGRHLCSACGGPLKPGIRFCGSCGAAVPEAPPRCPQCRQPVNPGARFCGSCGRVLDQI